MVDLIPINRRKMNTNQPTNLPKLSERRVLGPLPYLCGGQPVTTARTQTGVGAPEQRGGGALFSSTVELEKAHVYCNFVLVD
jgi:hypothetical protein